MHRKSDVGGGIASVTIQTDTPKPRQVMAAPDSGWGGGCEREVCTEAERERGGGGGMTTSESEGCNT